MNASFIQTQAFPAKCGMCLLNCTHTLAPCCRQDEYSCAWRLLSDSSILSRGWLGSRQVMRGTHWAGRGGEVDQVITDEGNSLLDQPA